LQLRKPYSNDLRRRIVEVYESGEYPQDEVAELLGACTATIRNLLRRKSEAGSPDAFPHAGGRVPTLAEEERKQVPALVTAHDDATLAELGTLAAQQVNKNLSPSSLCRLLQALGLPRKKSRSTPLSAIRRASSGREGSFRR
jgi:transposase